MNRLPINLQPSDTPTLWYTTHEHEHDQARNQDFKIDSSKEHMFEKSLTPSDVGKLNRLVIPKQHAEKYFPLATSTTVEGGYLLGFEDDDGKCWRFRYSYWNSSQSYVLTKGWSRFVKDKNLDAGDVILFDRHRQYPDRFYIGWRRRGSDNTTVTPTYCFNEMSSCQQVYTMSHDHNITSFSNNISSHSLHDHGPNQVRQNTRKSSECGNNNSRSVRLFGVNLECVLQQDVDIYEEPRTSDGSTRAHAFSLGSGLSMSNASCSYFDNMT